MVFGASAHSGGGLFGNTVATPSNPTLFPPRGNGGSLFGNTPATMSHQHICGLYFLEAADRVGLCSTPRRIYLPTVSQAVHARIVGNTSRTTLTQTYVNTHKSPIPELRFTFPLYDGVSVVDFTCTINNDRVIRGVVQERNTARKTYDRAVAKGETAGLLEQLPDASDVFTTTIGNVLADAEIKVDITYLGELKHDAEVDGIRFTIPTSIAPRYGSCPGQILQRPNSVCGNGGIQIVVDAEMPAGSFVKSIQSPSHPIAVTVGSTSTMTASDTPSLNLASATLSLGSAELERDFIVQVVTSDASNPVAILETHPTDAHQQAIMATLVPKFRLNTTKPEVVFVCDRSGSMGNKIPDLKNALHIFMKSLPVGCMFNICSFGTHHSLLFESSRLYDQDTLSIATQHIEYFAANYGGTHMYTPIEETFRRRHRDMDLEVFVLTDGEIWNQQDLFHLVNQHVEDSRGAIRLFTLGVGRDASHSLIEGLARAGRGFAQSVSDQEKMSGKVVRMLKAALTPHVTDYSLEVKYRDDNDSETEPDDDFEIIDPESPSEATLARQEPKKTLSLFDPTVTDDDVEMQDSKPDDGTGTDRFSHVPSVRPPKILQAPSRIPPLFPYNRTTVYLLLSPDRALRNKTPESVIIRGTSPQGPLELEVPVVSVGKGETLHQLAARKAVKELEEGRGWIYHAKGKDGERLEKKHPGRFTAMVEREAVRLGVKFQVGGKWCSFVAVEGNGDSTGDLSGPESSEGGPKLGYGSVRARGNHIPRKCKKAVGSSGGGLFGRSPASPSPPVAGGLFGSPSPPAAGGLFGSPPPPQSGGLFASPQPGGLFGSSQPVVSPTSASFGSQPRASLSSGSFGRVSSPGPVSDFSSMGYSPEPPTSSVLGAPVAAPSGASSFVSGAASAFGGGTCQAFGRPAQHDAQPSLLMARPSPFAQQGSSLFGGSNSASQHMQRAQPASWLFGGSSTASQQNAQQSSSLFGGLGGAQPRTSLFATSTGMCQAPHESKLSTLVRLQHFGGFWAWSAELLEALGIVEDEVNKALAGTHTLASHTAKATALAVVFLHHKLINERDSWEMMESKALEWLNGEVGKAHALILLDACKKLF
ncbi:von willebrand domain containing protein [Colletotrichum musicola]|uniref:von willebrand domain containing protein n=1 Tax=Colletotrichum musicola TaxID=2175873 RepID=A0A8H6KQA8_9PEZI|nr:von willebrand domain containing protein [Colletotrichum musicola]